MVWNACSRVSVRQVWEMRAGRAGTVTARGRGRAAAHGFCRTLPPRNGVVFGRKRPRPLNPVGKARRP
eukprot:65229-Chlamydomonas_euryale.AAC.2